MPSGINAVMRFRLAAPPVLMLLACGPKPAPSVQPESIGSMTLYDSADELLVSVLSALRKGEVESVRASIATPGQIEAMCHDYQISETPYDEPDVETAAARCVTMMGDQDETVFLEVIGEKIATLNKPSEDTSFTTHWAERCPELRLHQVDTVIETNPDPNGPMTGFEVSDVFEYRGQWGLMSIPRCRDE